MLTLANDFKTELLQSANDSSFRRVGRKPSACLENRVGSDGVRPERLDVETNRRFHIVERFVIAFPFADNYTFVAEGISNVAVCMFFYDDLDRAHRQQCSTYATESF